MDEFVMQLDDQEIDAQRKNGELEVSNESEEEQIIFDTDSSSDDDNQEDDYFEEDVADDEESSDEVDINPVEEEARAQGWVPEEEWSGNPIDWVPAKEFIFRGQLMDRIKSQTKALTSQNDEISSLKTALKELGEMNSKIAEKEYERALKDLRRQKAEALEDSDFDKVLEIDDRLDTLKEQKPVKQEEAETPETTEKKTAAEPPPEFVTWIENPQNQWYVNDVALRGAADAIFMDMVNNNQVHDLNEAYEAVAAKVKEEFPNKFGATQRKAPKSPVTSSQKRSTSANRSGKHYGPRDLSPDQRVMAKVFIESGALDSVQDYVDQLATLGELPVQKENR